MFATHKFFSLSLLTLFFAGVACGQEIDSPFAPGDRFSISHTPMNAKLVPLDCEAKKVPIHSYKHAGNEATFLIPVDSPTCTYEVLGTRIKVVRPLVVPADGVKHTAESTPPEKPRSR
jgi:hypothetical protein